ncbi:MAG: hypothetical protein SV422_06515 [Pseudomonadota bacterium]|nr:hypothetical protein [Pseudomonadota bacterium]
MLPTEETGSDAAQNLQTPDNGKPQVDQNRLRELHRWLGIFLKSTIAIGALLLFIDGNYQAGIESLIIMCVTFMPLIMASYFHLKIPLEFDTLAIIFIYMSLFLGEVQDFYFRFWWWDLVLHAGSGFLLGMTGFFLVYLLNEDKKADMHLTPGFIALFAFMFSQGLGSLWEIFEFAMDQIFGLNMQKSGLVDTMGDLIINAVAAAAISLLGYGYMKNPRIDSFLERMIDQFIRDNPRVFQKRKRRARSL